MQKYLKLLLTLPIFIFLINSSNLLSMDTIESFSKLLGLPEQMQQAMVQPESPVKQPLAQSCPGAGQLPGKKVYALPYLPTPFEPLKQPNDSDLIRKRIKAINDDSAKIFPNSILVPQRHRSGVCFTIAMEHALDLPPAQFKWLRESIVGSSEWFSILKVLKFFDQKENPEEQASVLYVSSSEQNKIIHAGWVEQIKKDGSIMVQSKFGSSSQYITELFEMPNIYGDTAFFCTLKPEFANESGKQYIFSEFQRRIAKSKRLKLKLEFVRNSIFEIVNNPSPKLQNNQKSLDLYIKKAIEDKERAWNCLERFPAIDINAQDNNGNTALMCAAKNGKHILIKMFLKHGAEINIQNNQGLTVIEIAKNSGHHNIADFILKHHNAQSTKKA